MKKAKLCAICLIIILVLTQFSMVSAAPSHDVAGFVSGTVTEIVYETDPNSGESTVWVTLMDEQGNEQKVQLTEENAKELHLLAYDYETDAWVPNEEMLEADIDIPLSFIIPPDDGGMKHPVANALATFFSKDVSGLDYDLIMTAHEDGFGFGVIAQALWLTKQLGGDSDVLWEVLNAKKSGDYSYFTLVDGTVPMNWGQFRKAVMKGNKSGNLGLVMSSKDKGKGNADNNGSHGNAANNGNKDKDKTNNGNHGNSGNNGNKDNSGNNGNNGSKGNNGNKVKP